MTEFVFKVINFKLGHTNLTVWMQILKIMAKLCDDVNFFCV
ncbi:hypothetical protein [Clostridium beijerinckii]|jgi:hypothetical protein|nr:hypothetical protein [Clostridium beijerinckii]NRT26341.1 hypothetical protein [Clostridium beijerinckii]NRT66052.1 hypothetical protein [Clostridium beijerinckii]NRT82438.1 hypothetical protein [Clostridium beijerinckii]NRU50860.1 hypothetical protein [Clostridium beijerinckii]NRZ30999.1 hypothetical protein [Clostridium beijerinckii]